jgi:Apea-like HEPN
VSISHVRDDRLFELACAAVKSGLDFASTQIQRKAYIGTYSDIPEMRYSENGMPSFSKMFNGPSDYKKIFDARVVHALIGATEDHLDFRLEDQPEFHVLKEHFENSPPLWKRMLSALGDEQKNAFFDIEVKLFITYQIDRYVHTYGTTEFSPSRLLPIYLPFETIHLVDVLPVDIWIPILFVKFEEAEVILEDGVHIRKIPDDMQLARAETKSYGLAVHEDVLGSATHAFVLTNYEIANSHWGEWSKIARTSAAFPTDKVDLLFAMLRLVTGADTGYAQLLMDPQGWASNYEADLRPLTGTSIRRYPPAFENYYWTRSDLPNVDLIQARSIGDLYGKVSRLDNEHFRNRLLLATQRLNYCFLRENEEDAILDATSALEVLLTPGDHSEITHKLATRLAALSRLEAQENAPNTVFRNIKRVYGHRSNVIHGNISKLRKSNRIQISETEAVPSVKVATDYLRSTLRVLIQNPEFLEPSKIDEQLLLGSNSHQS